MTGLAKANHDWVPHACLNVHQVFYEYAADGRGPGYGVIEEAVPIDMHRLWMLALVCWLSGRLDEPDLARRASDLLAPYDGQAIIVGGCVQWMGLVTHYRGIALPEQCHGGVLQLAQRRE